MRPALLVVTALAFSACDLALRIDNYPRPFACDRTGGDGGQQCNAGWSCGFDNRCFDKKTDRNPDAGVLVELWRCTNDTQCPNDWKCSQEVGGLRYCQQVGVGAPTQCLDDDGGCEGGWRCSGGNKCFDPDDVDGGTTRACTADRQCPNGFRCGQLVGDRPQLCLELDAGAPSWCLDDRGCEGGWRCNPVTQQCVLVEDALAVGQLADVSITRLNPRVSEPAPLLFAMTSFTTVPSEWAGSGQVPGDGVMLASLLTDGGLRLAVQPAREARMPDGGLHFYFERVVPLPAGVPPTDVAELVLGVKGPAIRLRDDSAHYLPVLDSIGTWRRVDGGAQALRQSSDLGLDPQNPLPEAIYALRGAQLDDLSFSFLQTTPATPLLDYFPSTQGLFYLGPNGMLQLNGTPVPYDSAGGVPALAQRPTSVSAGVSSSGRLAYLVELPPSDGGTTFIAFRHQPNVGFSMTPSFPACPQGQKPLQLTVGEDDQKRPIAISRCPAPIGGGSFPVKVGLFDTVVSYTPVIEDPIPFAGPVVSQRGAPWVRAHASTDGRAWHALVKYTFSPMAPPTKAIGELGLRPLVLDRQPQTMLSLIEPGTTEPRIYAQAGGLLFNAEPAGGGFFSELKENEVNPLTAVVGHPSWVLVRGGLAIIEGGGPRALATMPSGVTLSPPASASSTQMVLEGAARQIVIATSGDSVWAADITDSLQNPFVQPATFERVLVPVPGVNLRAMTLEPADGGLSGYLTTNTDDLRFATSDLLRWAVSPVLASTPARPMTVWSEPDGGRARAGFSDGVVYSLPITVPLTQPLVAQDGGALVALDFGRKCGDLFVATREGLFRAQPPPDGGLPRWTPLTALNQVLRPGGSTDLTTSLELFETHDLTDRLFLTTRNGLVLELTSSTACP